MYKPLIESITACAPLSMELVAKLLVKPQTIQHGDFALPCFALSKEWKLSPPECAAKLSKSLILPPEFERSEPAGPYLNFYFKRAWFANTVLSQIKAAPDKFGRSPNSLGRYIVEYSSPNIAKPFHVGHLRATLIGHALDRILRHRGYEVISINHLGDWGTQFGFVYAGCKVWGTPENATVDELVDRYRAANALRKAQDEGTASPEDAAKPNINQMARDYFIKLERGEKEATEFWNWVLEISMLYFKDIYKRLGVHFDHFIGESFYRDKLDKVESDLRKSGILVDSKGALGVELGKKLGFARVFAEDGRSLYITRDLATADYRYKTFAPDKILIVIGNPQELYLKQLFAILEAMHHPIAGKIEHVSFGHVPGISTRKQAADNERIFLSDLLDDAHDRARDAYRAQIDKKPDGLDEERVAEAVGLSAIFFDYLSRTNNKDFHFDWETALSFQGDTGPYVLYALARLNSIQTKASEAGLTSPNSLNAELLTDDKSYELISMLSKFEDALTRSCNEFEPHHVALYSLSLAKCFSSCYRDLRVLGEVKELAEARLALFSAVRNVLRVAVSLIGMQPLDRM